MSEDNDNYINRIPEFDAMTHLQQRMSQAKPSQTNDPYQLMLKRKAINSGEIQEPTQTWPNEDVIKLEEFCRKMGILGFNCGRMSPLSALAFLKQKLGVVEDIPKTEGFGPNYPYTEAIKKRLLLKG